MKKLSENCKYKIPLWKQVFDKVFSFTACVFFFPVALAIALAIKIEDGGPVFYLHERVGLGGKLFKLIKFRTMCPNADRLLEEILRDNPHLRSEWERNFKLKDDPRVTRVGRFLRKTSLDELPQFINVLKGDMSVVGPRPVVPEELEKYYGDKAEYYISVKPGITGYWQVEARSDVCDYRERVEMDVWYVKNMSFWLDMKIIAKTVWVMLTGKGAY